MLPTNFDPERYHLLLAEKTHQLQALLSKFAARDLQVFPSAAEFYRLRAEFRVWHQDNDLFYVMFDDQRKPLRIDSMPQAGRLINQLMPVLLAEIKPVQSLSHRLFQVCLLYTSPSPRDRQKSRMPSSA